MKIKRNLYKKQLLFIIDIYKYLFDFRIIIDYLQNFCINFVRTYLLAGIGGTVGYIPI